MTRKSKTYDNSSEESFATKVIDFGIVRYNSYEVIDNIFTIENYGGTGDILSLKMGSDSAPNEFNKFMGFYGDGVSLGQITGFSGGASNSGLYFDLYQDSSYKDMGFRAGELYIEKSSSLDSKVLINTNDSTAILNVSAKESNTAIRANIDSDNINNTWMEFAREGDTQYDLRIIQDSDDNVQINARPRTAATKGLYINVESGGFEAYSDGDLNINSAQDIGINSSQDISLNAGSSQINFSSESSEPIMHINSTPPINVFWLKFGSDGGVIRRNGDTTDPFGNMDAFRAIDHSGAEDNYGRSKSGLQFLSANSDFAEYFDVEHEDFLKYESDGTIDLPEGIVVYVRDNKCRSELPGVPMVVSKSALLAGNMTDGMNNLLSFSGQINIFVEGKVDAGDLLVPKGNICVAIKKDKVTMSQYIDAIGRAAESSEEDGLKKVNCLIGVK